MRIAMLSAGTGWHVADLIRAANLEGHQARTIDFRKVSFLVSGAGGRFTSEEVGSWQGGGPGSSASSCLISSSFRPDFDAVVVRTMPPGSLEQVVFRMDVLHQLARRGVTVYNPPRSLECCIDKYMTTALLDAAGLPVPSTLCCQDAETALAALDSLGGDVIVKPLFGSEGRGLVRVSDREMGWRTFRTLERLQSVLYVQQFIPHEGWDLRVFVLDGEVLTAMRRRSAGDWRTNIAQGGAGEPVDLDPEVAELALRAAAAVGTAAAGVDLLLSRTGRWYVIEVNAVPGWRRLTAVTQVDIARAMIRSVVKAVQNNTDRGPWAADRDERHVP